MLLGQEELAELPAKFRWGYSAISHILSKFENEAGPRTAFPCIFAPKAVKRGNLRFLLIPYEPENSRYELGLLASGLRTYIDQININALDVNHNRSLLVLFEPVATLTTTDQLKKIFIEATQFLLDEDRRPWPSHVSKDPAHRTWTMCFHGCELFMNVSHPAHALRRSRNMGAGLAFVINPRKIFDIAAPANQQGSAITARTRKNIDIYDDVTHSGLLGSYVLGEAQWQPGLQNRQKRELEVIVAMKVGHSEQARQGAGSGRGGGCCFRRTDKGEQLTGIKAALQRASRARSVLLALVGRNRCIRLPSTLSQGGNILSCS